MGHKIKQSVSARELARALDLDLIGVDTEIVGVSSYPQAVAMDLTFTKSVGYWMPGITVIASDPSLHMQPEARASTVLMSDNPRLDFIRALAHLEKTVGFVQPDFPSRVHPSVVQGQAVIIEDGCEIAEGVVLGHNVVVRAGSVIGKHSVIRPGAVIGGEGFGFSRLEDGTPLRFVHLGGVQIGQNVEIGENTSICRGTLNDTVIEDHVKIDNLVHLAHNCYIKKGAFIIACAELSGGVTIGKNAWIGPKVSIIEKVSIGDGALVGIGSVVLSDVPDNCVFVGNPAKFLKSLQ